MSRRWAIARGYLAARRRRTWSRTRLERHQLACLRALPGLGDARSIDEALGRLPLVDPRTFAEDYARHNVLGLDLATARALAREELESRSARHPSISFGLSTGTTGEPGVFLTTTQERDAWAGAVFGKLMGFGELARALVRRRGLTIALVLKHDSRLYGDVGGLGRVRLRHFDLAEPPALWAAELAALAPDIVVAPPSALLALARELGDPGSDARSFAPRASELGTFVPRSSELGTFVPRLSELGTFVPRLSELGTFVPRMLVSAAEPLGDRDRRALADAFGVVPREIYQAREGFLAASCAEGRLHCNEDLAVFEAMPFADDPTRFVPVITDFARRSERYRRYRLDDVLRAVPGACACGSACASVEVEGRLQDVLVRWDGVPVFPRDLEAAIADVVPAGRELVLTQTAWDTFTLAIEFEPGESVRAQWKERLASRLTVPGEMPPAIVPVPWTPPAPAAKRRRFRREIDADSTSLTSRLRAPRRPSPGTFHTGDT